MGDAEQVAYVLIGAALGFELVDCLAAELGAGGCPLASLSWAFACSEFSAASAGIVMDSVTVTSSAATPSFSTAIAWAIRLALRRFSVWVPWWISGRSTIQWLPLRVAVPW